VKDITIPDGTTFTPGAQFTKTWRLKNIGSCTWTSNYALVFSNGNQMGGPIAVSLAGVVQPGDVVDLSVNLVAPTQAGDYQGFWKLRDAAGVHFGVGPNSADPFWVKIKVVAGNTVIYDLTKNYCNATWQNSVTSLPCPSPRLDENIGFIYRDDAAFLENGSREDEPALITHPDQGVGLPNRPANGWIFGTFPAYEVKVGDHFKSVIGCLFDHFECNVIFQLNYRVDGGPIQTLSSWNETYDNNLTSIDMDLSSLAGKRVEIILMVLDNGNSIGDWAFWLYPRILR
jgi:hypothetical protein